MADNVQLNSGTGGAVIATDDDATAHHQYVKIEFGVDNTQTKVTDADGARLPIKPHMAATATRSSVADSATAVEILAANSARKGAVISNDSSAILYLGLGTVDPTTTNYTTKIPQDQTYQIPVMYTGQIKGIWATDPGDGAARVTELT